MRYRLRQASPRRPALHKREIAPRANGSQPSREHPVKHLDRVWPFTDPTRWVSPRSVSRRCPYDIEPPQARDVLAGQHAIGSAQANSSQWHGKDCRPGTLGARESPRRVVMVAGSAASGRRQSRPRTQASDSTQQARVCRAARRTCFWTGRVTVPCRGHGKRSACSPSNHKSHRPTRSAAGGFERGLVFLRGPEARRWDSYEGRARSRSWFGPGPSPRCTAQPESSRGRTTPAS
jgi:hypothetical protein